MLWEMRTLAVGSANPCCGKCQRLLWETRTLAVGNTKEGVKIKPLDKNIYYSLMRLKNIIFSQKTEFMRKIIAQVKYSLYLCTRKTRICLERHNLLIITADVD